MHLSQITRFSLMPTQMDSLFLDIVLLLSGGHLEEMCPSPVESGAIICGAVLSKRKMNTRLEVWLGGPSEPDAAWIQQVTRVFAENFRDHKMFPFKPFS